MAFDLLTATPDTTFPATGFLFGADAQSGNPSIYSAAAYAGYLATATLAAGTLTTSQPFTHSQTWNAAGVTFRGHEIVITDTASAAASTLFRVLGGAAGTTAYLSLDRAGILTLANNLTVANNSITANGFRTTGTFGNVSILTDTSPALNFGALSDVIMTRAAAASLQHGSGDVDTAPVAQTIRTQGALAGGTSDVAGANWTFIASPGKGTGAGGQFIFRTAPAGSTGTTVNALATALTLTAPAVNMQPSVVVGNQALATTATDGFLYIPQCAGTPTGVPTAFTGRVPMVWDTTNKKFYIYDGAWLGGTAPGVFS